jgi:hypothetical protein
MRLSDEQNEVELKFSCNLNYNDKVVPVISYSKQARKVKVRSRLRVIILAVMIALTYRKFIKKIVKKIRRVSKVANVIGRPS